MELLRVLIVDDEFLIRNLLRNRIHWEEQGLTIVGEASNAHEAMDLVDELRPDIIFTDICMPFVNGIDFSGMVMEKHPEIKIVIVTGHDEFEFARKSIQVGISDFILKPIGASELLNVTERLKKKIYDERSKKNEFEKLKEELRQSLPFLKEKFFNRWILQHLSENEIIEKKAYFQIPLENSGRPFQIAVFEISLPSSKQTEENALLVSMECRKQVEAYFKNTPDAVVFSDHRNQIVILSDNHDTDFADACELLKTKLINSLRYYVCVGVSGRHKNLSEVPIAYQEACRALNFKAFAGKNQVVCYNDIIEMGEQHYHSNPELLEKLLLNISAGSAERAVVTLKSIFSMPFTEAGQLRLAAMDIITKCQYAAIEQKVDGDDCVNADTLIGILAADNLPELLKNLEGYVTVLANAINSKNNLKADSLIEQVKDYLEDNLPDPGLGLASTAAAFFVSPGHLGRLMKKETGHTFVEYLTNLRIRKAEILLKTTELKVYQVGEAVGIMDPHYFSILFKKNCGKSVNEYRNDIK